MKRLGMMLCWGLLCGCSDPAVEGLTAVRDVLCKCTEPACVDAAMAGVKDWPVRDRARAAAIAKEITVCMARIYESTAPP
jgi:hypothetical protein